MSWLIAVYVGRLQQKPVRSRIWSCDALAVGTQNGYVTMAHGEIGWRSIHAEIDTISGAIETTSCANYATSRAEITVLVKIVAFLRKM